MELISAARTATYTVSKVEIVDPDDVSVLQPRREPSLTLVTCYPFYFVGAGSPAIYCARGLEQAGSHRRVRELEFSYRFTLGERFNLVKEEREKMTKRVNRILTALTAIGVAAAMAMNAAAQQQMPQTTKEAIRGSSSIATEHLQGTVEYVEGSTLVVRMADGGIREFNVPDSRRFLIDGTEVTVHDLKPGTKLSAMITTTTTPVIDRTTTVGTGKVWWVSGKTVILTLPNGENRQYTVKDDYKFTVNGEQECHGLRSQEGYDDLGRKDCGRAQDGDRFQHGGERTSPAGSETSCRAGTPPPAPAPRRNRPGPSCAG